MTRRTVFSGALVAASLLLTPQAASAQSIIEQAAEHRFQLDFHVTDTALAKMLPPGWETVVATQGPAKGANLRMIFIDRVAIIGGDGKPAARSFALSREIGCSSTDEFVHGRGNRANRYLMRLARESPGPKRPSSRHWP